MVISVVGAKGGIGKTTVAVNLAVLLAKRHGEKVALVELPGQVSDGGMFLDLTTRHGFLSLTEVPAVDADFLARIMSTHESGVHYLGATSDRPAEELSRTSAATVELAGQVLGALKRRFTAVILDCPVALWPLASYMLRRSHTVVAMATLEDMAVLRSALSLRELLGAAGVDSERVVPVVNRAQRSGALGLEDYTRVTSWEKPMVIPEDARSCAAALNEGVPLVLKSPGAPASQAIARLAREVAERARRVTGATVARSHAAG